jgi:hypothetical protein
VLFVAATASAARADVAPPTDPRALVTALAKGELAVEQAIDRRRGLITIVFTNGGEGDPIHESQRLCGDAVDRWLAEHRESLMYILRNADDITCAAQPQASCVAFLAGEYASTLELLLVRAGDRWTIETIVERDSAYRRIAAERAFIKKRLERERARRCPQSP